MSIVKMKEVTICGLLRDKDNILGKLQDLSLLHIKSFSEKRNDVAHRINALKSDLLKIKRVESIIESKKSSKTDSINTDVGDLRLAIDRIISLEEERVSNIHKLSIVKNHINKLRSWGDFDFNSISKLKDHGLKFVFSIFTYNDWEALDKTNLAYKIINKDGKKLWILFISSLNFHIRCTEIKLPFKRLSEFIRERDEITKKIKDIDLSVELMMGIERKIDDLRRLTIDQINYFYAHESTLVYGPVFFIRGFVPSSECKDFQDKMQILNITFLSKDPKCDDDVPVKLKNGWFVNGFESVLKAFTGISYHEKDITWFVAILFITFASLCLLDAGYSICLSLTGFFIYYKKGIRLMGKVFIITGVFSLILGILSGQFFGLIIGEHVLKNSKPILALSSTPLFCLMFSLCVGVVVMLFSYILAIWQFGLKTPNTGNLFFLVSLIFFTLGNLFSETIHNYLLSMHIICIQAEFVTLFFKYLGFIFIFLTLVSWILYPENAFGKNSRLPNVSWTIYSGTTGVVQDILSHMRLFGIALSGGILALVVNKVSAMMPFVGSVIFASVSHIAVYCMALISMYVHTNRLIFLEFGKNCLNGGSVYYTPLSRSLLK